MLAQPTLPLDLIDPCMEMMKAMMPSEREFVRVIVEVIIDLRDDEESTEEPAEIVRMLSLCARSFKSPWCRLHTTSPSQTLRIRNRDENGHSRFWLIMRGWRRKTVRLQIQETSAVWWFAILCWSASTAYVPFLVARLLLRSIIAVWWQFNATRCPEWPYHSICSKKGAFPARKSTDESRIMFAHCQSKTLYAQEVFVPKLSLLLSAWLWVHSNSSQTSVCEHQIQYESSYYALSSISC